MQSPGFRSFWFGQSVSAAGSMMQMATVRWHIYLLTGNPISLGLLGLTRFLPLALFSLIGGAVADARDHRKILFTTQTCLLLGAAALGALTWTNHITPFWIYAINFLSATAIAFDNPARQSLLPHLVPRNNFANAASLNSITFQVATIVGPMVAGRLIGAGLLAAVYFVNSISFLAVIIALFKIKPEAFVRGEPQKVDFSWQSLKEGLLFVRKSDILVWTIAVDFFATFFSSADALLPAIAKDILHVGPRGYGFLTSAEAIGSVIMGAMLAARRPIRRQGIAILGAAGIYGVATVCFGASRIFWVSVLALAVVGAADTISTVLRQTIRQMVTPDHLRGRMTATNMIFFMGGPQLGNLEAGIVARWMGTPFSVISGGIGCIISVSWIAFKAKGLRNYQREEAVKDV